MNRVKKAIKELGILAVLYGLVYGFRTLTNTEPPSLNYVLAIAFIIIFMNAYFGILTWFLLRKKSKDKK